jgi:TRAP-type C4-dicarboxylate transport system substrate-binding protein
MVWDKLNADEQALLEKCAQEGRVAQIARSREAVNGALKKLKSAGMEVSELPANEMTKLREIVAPVYEAALPVVGEENFKKMMTELKVVRGQ